MNEALRERYYIRRERLIAVILAFPLAYLSFALGFGGALAIEVANSALFGLATGVAVAYWPEFRAAMAKPLISEGEILRVGIFVSWCAADLARIGSIIWRMYGKPGDWLDNTLWGLHISFSCSGAVCHLIAHHAFDGAVPRLEWVKIGAQVAGAVFVVALLLLAA